MTDADLPVLLPPGLRARLVFVRHGESTWIAEGRFQGRGDPPLSERGRLQARLVAERLRDRGTDPALPLPTTPPLAVWHSPLSRTSQTATAIADALRGGDGAPGRLEATPDLIEIDQGEWQGMLATEVAQRYAPILDAWRAAPLTAHAPGGEGLDEAGHRVRRALRAIVAGLDAGGAETWGVVVAHDGIFRLSLMTLLGVPYDRFWSFPFSLCALSILELAEGRTVLRVHNLADHLAGASVDAAGRAEATGDRRGAL